MRNGLLEITPISSRRLTALAVAPESHATILLEKKNVPVRYFTPLIEYLSSCCGISSARGAFEPLYQDAAAEILFDAFLGLRSDDSDRVVSSLLCWLNPGNVDVFAATQQPIMGCGSGEISIRLIFPNSPEAFGGNKDAWEIQ